MNLRRFLPRLWLACCVVVCLGVAWRARVVEQKTVSREPVAEKGKVVVVQVGSQAGAGAYVSLRYRKPDGSEREFYQMEGKLKQEIQYRGKRMSFSLASMPEDTVIVTLDMNPEEPRLYEDRFCNEYGDQFIRAKLLTADEVELYYAFDLSCSKRHLLRNEAGRLISQGLPYRSRALLSSVAVFSPEYKQVNSYTLPPLPHAKEKELWEFPVSLSTPIGDSAAARYHRQIRTLFLGSPARSFIHAGFCRSSPDGFSVMPGVSKRLQDMREAVSFFRDQTGVSATVAGGPELLLPRLDEMRASRKFCLTPWELKLPCFNTYYDHIVAEMRYTYGFQYDYCTELLEQSVPLNDELAVCELILHELKMVGL